MYKDQTVGVYWYVQWYVAVCSDSLSTSYRLSVARQIDGRTDDGHPAGSITECVECSACTAGSNDAAAIDLRTVRPSITVDNMQLAVSSRDLYITTFNSTSVLTRYAT